MEHAATGLTELAVVAAIAVLCGLALGRLRQPPIVGYILAGVVLGPTGVGLIENSANIQLMAELGVLMLLFLIGMELSLKAFTAALRVALPVALLQIAIGLGLAFALAPLVGLNTTSAIVIGFVIALSSTAVALKILEDIGELRSQTGRVTIGILLAQDLAVVPMILTIEALAGDSETSTVLVAVRVLAGVAVLALIIWLLGKRGKIRLPLGQWMAKHPDMTPLAAIALCFGAAAISGVAGLSAAYGAFVAGLIVANSHERKPMLRATHPIQAVLLVVFFLSVGLLLDLDYIWNNLAIVLIFLLAAVVVKTIINVVLLRLLRQPWEVAFPAGVAMGQLGEFSFVLVGLAVANGTVDGDAYRLAISVIALSLLISPIWMVSARRFHDLAAEGVSSMRHTLAEVYRGEITAVQISARAVRGVGRATAGLVRRRRRSDRAATAASDPVSGPDSGPDSGPQAGADSGPTGEPDRGPGDGADSGADSAPQGGPADRRPG